MALEDRTEQATPQRREEARKKGQVAKSMEVTSAFILLAGLLTLKILAPVVLGQLAANTHRFLGNLSSFNGTPEGAAALFMEAMISFFRIMAPVLGAVGLAAMVANFSQVGFVFSLQPLAPDITRIDPIKGLGRMFSVRSLVELIKSLLKTAVVSLVVWAFLKNEVQTVISLGVVDQTLAGRIAGDLIWRLCIRACAVLLVIASLDYLYQRIQFEKSIRMTKQEVKEEFKRSEGDPQIKAQFKRRHRELAMRRMMLEVPKADVVITNPTHIAVALRYDAVTMAAPVVVAKGQRLIAEKIKEIAKQHSVPMVENKPVARALFASAEIGDPVPVELYQAVAEILAFVYRLKRGMGYRID